MICPTNICSREFRSTRYQTEGFNKGLCEVPCEMLCEVLCEVLYGVLPALLRLRETDY
jgi:hypothetical protein